MPRTVGEAVDVGVGGPHGITQRWARTIRAAHPGLDGMHPGWWAGVYGRLGRVHSRGPCSVWRGSTGHVLCVACTGSGCPWLVSIHVGDRNSPMVVFDSAEKWGRRRCGRRPGRCGRGTASNSGCHVREISRWKRGSRWSQLSTTHAVSAVVGPGQGPMPASAPPVQSSLSACAVVGVVHAVGCGAAVEWGYGVVCGRCTDRAATAIVSCGRRWRRTRWRWCVSAGHTAAGGRI